MSRSYKKHPIVGNSLASSEKKDKSMCNKKLRRASRIILKDLKEDAIFPLNKEAYDVWSMAKDGKHYLSSKYIEELKSDNKLHKLLGK